MPRPRAARRAPLSPAAQQIFDTVIDAMQEAEEIGIGDDDYVPLMRAIAQEAETRIDNMHAALRMSRR